MLLQWSQHSQEMVEKLSSLLSRQSLLDITLAAEGKQIRAHKVVLAAASQYFEVTKLLIQITVIHLLPISGPGVLQS